MEASPSWKHLARTINSGHLYDGLSRSIPFTVAQEYDAETQAGETIVSFTRQASYRSHAFVHTPPMNSSLPLKPV